MWRRGRVPGARLRLWLREKEQVIGPTLSPSVTGSVASMGGPAPVCALLSRAVHVPLKAEEVVGSSRETT